MSYTDLRAIWEAVRDMESALQRVLSGENPHEDIDTRLKRLKRLLEKYQ